MVEDINCCCKLFYVIDCADSDEHDHIGCDAKSGLDENPVIDNEHAKAFCIGERFKECPYYPREG